MKAFLRALAEESCEDTAVVIQKRSTEDVPADFDLIMSSVISIHRAECYTRTPPITAEV